MANPLDRLRLNKEARARAATLGAVLSLILLFQAGSKSRVNFDRRTLLFSLDGRKVNAGALRRQLQSMESQLAAVMVLYVDRLLSGEWKTDKWRDEMEALLRQSHLLFAALAAGGLAAVVAEPALLKVAELRAERDIRYLGGFSEDVRKGKYKNGRRALNRAKSYLKSARITYANVQLELAKLAGFTEARRILNAKESCRRRLARIGCVEAAERGWVLIDDMPPIGTLVCKQFCLCYLEFR